MKDDRKLKESMTEYVTDSQIAKKNCSVWRNEDKGMEKLIIGIDLCDNLQPGSCPWGVRMRGCSPTVICRKKAAEEWYGEDAYKYTLVGEGVIVDKLLSLAAKEGTSTIGGVKYGGMELLQRFLAASPPWSGQSTAGRRSTSWSSA